MTQTPMINAQNRKRYNMRSVVHAWLVVLGLLVGDVGVKRVLNGTNWGTRHISYAKQFLCILSATVSLVQKIRWDVNPVILHRIQASYH